MRAERLYRVVTLLMAWVCCLCAPDIMAMGSVCAADCFMSMPAPTDTSHSVLPVDTVRSTQPVDTLLPTVPVDTVLTVHKADTVRMPHSRMRRERGTATTARPTVLPVRDSAMVARDSAMVVYADSLQQRAMEDTLDLSRFHDWRPDPIRAMWLGMVFPGGGQIYNRKYWKLPFVYGGVVGCVYAVSWNSQMLRDYSQAYQDITDSDPTTNSYLEMLPLGYDITGREDHFKSVFKRKKDFYRRYRDLSIFCIAGVYLLSIIDAYVDAELSTFDIGPDLSLHVSPAVIPSGSQSARGTMGSSPGITLQLTY